MNAPELNTHIIDNYDDFIEFSNYVRSIPSEHLAVDVETDGLIEKTCNIYGIAFALEDHEGFYIPIKDKNGNSIWQEKQTEVEIFIKDFCSTKKLIMHNGVYDTLCIKNNFGIDLVNYLYADTLLMKHLIDEHPPHALKDIATRYLGSWATSAKDDLIANVVANGGSTTKDNFQMFKADTNILGRYAAYDVILTLRLFHLFTPKLKEEHLEDLFYKDEIMPVYREVVIPMKDKGFPIDLEHFKNLKVEITAHIQKLEDLLYDELQEKINHFERVEMWKEFGTKKRGGFPIAMAQVLDIELPTIKGKLSLSKESLKVVIAKNEKQQQFLEWLQNDQEQIPEPLFEDTSIAHRNMFVTKYETSRVFNLNSTQHLAWLFFEKLEIVPTEFTDGGKPKLDAETLQDLSGQHKFVDKIIEYKKLQKLLSTYVDGVLERQINGTLYTSMLLAGTTSGRFASRDPNLNNLPAIKEEGGKLSPLVVKYTNAIRKGMIAPKGYKMISLDFASLEPHIAAFASGDSGLIDIFVNEKDFYSAIGIKQFSIKDASPYEKDPNYFGKKYKDLRKLIKTYALAAFYGATAPRIAQVTGKTREEAQNLLNGYFEAFPCVKDFIEESHEQALTRGIVRTRLGRVRHLYQAKTMWTRYGSKILDYKWANNRGMLSERGVLRNLLNNSVNFQIQGYAAHCLNRAMIKMTRKFKEQNLDARIVLAIHDEVLIVVKEETVTQAASIAKHSMETCVNMGEIKLKATPIIGRSYGDCK